MSFDRLAPHYRWMEAVLAGNKLQRCRVAFLDEVRQSRHALILGEGNGRFLSALLKVNPSIRVLCVDGSAQMQEQARARLTRNGRLSHNVEFVHADILKWSPPADEFDLLVTHFFLDCFRPEQIEEIVSQLSRVASVDARWLLADFREPAHGPSKWRARSILALMYGFFSFMTKLPARRLTPPDSFLQRHGFQLQTRRCTEWGLLHTDLWRFRKRSSSDAGRNVSRKPTGCCDPDAPC